MNGLEVLFFELIKDFEKKDLEQAIKERISLIKLIRSYAPYLLKLGKTLQPIYGGQAQIDYYEVMKLLKQSKPEFYEIIQASKTGQKWLKQQIKEIKNACLKGNN